MFGLFLTLLKPFNTALVLILIYQDKRLCAALAILFLMLCDIFDGVSFRRSPLASNKKLLWLRRVADIAGDRIAIEAVLLWMLLRLNFPPALYSVEGVREVFLGCLIIYGYWKRRPLREPNLLSRISAFCVGIMAMAWLAWPIAAPWLLLPVVGFGIPGALKYYRTIISGAG